jgi:hypothetical protein
MPAIRQRLPRLPTVHTTHALHTIMPYIPLSYRKDLMTLLQVGGTHRTNSRIRKRCIHMNRNTVVFETASGIRSIGHDEIMFTIQPYLETPTLRGLLSLYLRSIRVDDEQDAANALASGLRKELQTTQTTTRVATISYPMLSSYEHSATIPMHPDLPFRPFAQVYMHNLLHQWRRKLQNYLLLPQCSYKSIGLISEQNLLRDAGIHLSPGIKYHTSTAVLETHYMQTGRQVEGPCEVRAAWKYSQLKPRIYYAIGATDYFAARYTWRIFDSLQRVLKASDPFHRFTFHRFPDIDFSQEVFLIYDYTSFTSNLADFPRFCHELAAFLRGHKCKIFDTRYGLVEVDLGDILHTYNTICNTNGAFDVSRVLTFPDGADRVILHHHVAGMLGVYGNITGSTALHGIVGVMIAGNEDRVNTIGDDAAGIFRIDQMSVEEVKAAIRVLGDIEEEKFEIWEEDQSMTGEGIGWKFVKRPLNVEDQVIKGGWMPDFPIYPVLLAEEDDAHDSVPQPYEIRRRSAIRQSVRLMESMKRHLEEVDDRDIQIVLEYLRWLFACLQLPSRGSLPCGQHRSTKSTDQSRYSDEYLATPVLIPESIKDGWWATLCNNVDTETGYLRLPVEAPTEVMPDKMIQGDVFVGIGRRIYGLLENIGIIEKRALYEDRLVTDDSVERLSDFMLGRRKAAYEYTVLSSYGPWTSYVDGIRSGLIV